MRMGELLDVVVQNYYVLGIKGMTSVGRIETASFIRQLKRAFNHPRSPGAQGRSGAGLEASETPPNPPGML